MKVYENEHNIHIHTITHRANIQQYGCVHADEPYLDKYFLFPPKHISYSIYKLQLVFM